MNNVEIIILIVVILLALFFILPAIMNYASPAEKFDPATNTINHVERRHKVAVVSQPGQSNSLNQPNQSEQPPMLDYGSQQESLPITIPDKDYGIRMMDPRIKPGPETRTQDDLTFVYVPHKDSPDRVDPDNVSGYDPDDSQDGGLTPRGPNKNYESLIFDDVTRSIMTGSQFMENTGLVTPPWVAPAWDPDAYGPSSKAEIDPADYDNDPRMLYNKCSLSCCSPQYPTPFQGDADPFVCDKDGNNKYLASNYICQNNTGGTGCLCMTPKQVDGMYDGWVDYYVDKKNLGY